MLLVKRESCRVFIPCHNRKAQTLHTIGAVRSLSENLPDLRIHVLDDGSSDGTSEEIQANFDDVTVHQLSGKHFWGGALNYILDYLRELECGDDEVIYVLIMNDDLLLDQPSQLLNGFLSLKSGVADIVAPILIDIGITQTDHDPREQVLEVNYGLVYEPSTGAMRSLEQPGYSNLCVTAATWFSRNTLIKASKIPRGIPHYLSDCWLTHSLFRLGHQIITLDSYQLKRWAKHTTQPTRKDITMSYWQSCCNPKSPNYLPAGSRFTRAFSKRKDRFIQSLLLDLKFCVYRVLTRPKRGIALLEL